MDTNNHVIIESFLVARVTILLADHDICENHIRSDLVKSVQIVGLGVGAFCACSTKQKSVLMELKNRFVSYQIAECKLLIFKVFLVCAGVRLSDIKNCLCFLDSTIAFHGCICFV